MNEKLSALLLRQECAAVDELARERAGAIILDTIDHIARSESAKLVLDLDLAGLGQSRAQFEHDSAMVFKEVEHLVDGWDEYTQKRSDFFQGLLARPRLYLTDTFAHLEAPARANMLAASRAHKEFTDV